MEQDKWLHLAVFRSLNVHKTHYSSSLRYNVRLTSRSEKREEHIVRPIFLLKVSVTLYTIHKPVLLHLTSPSYLIVTLVFVSDCKLCVYIKKKKSIGNGIPGYSQHVQHIKLVKHLSTQISFLGEISFITCLKMLL